MKQKFLTLLTLLLCAVTGVWADDAVSATQTFQTVTVSRDSCVWSSFNVSIAIGNTAGGDGVYFTAPSDKALSANGDPAFGKCAWIGYFQVPSATSSGYITMISNADANDRPLYLNSYDATTNPSAKLVCAKKGSRVAFTSSDVVYKEELGGYFVQLSNTDKADVKFKTIGILLNGESYPEAAAVDPVFSLTSTTISTSGTSQIRVGSKSDLDGITLSNIAYGTSGVVTVDEHGVVTAVAAGSTTISYDSEAVAGKYNASTGNSVSITVISPITVFDASAMNAEFVLSKENITAATNEFVTTSTEDWASRTPTGYSSGDYYNLSGTSRYITFKASGASTFQIIIQNGSGSNDRKFTVKIGEGDAETITATKNTTNTTKVFATGSTGEVTITITGTSDGSLYPAAIIFNPAVSIAPANAMSTYVTTKALNFSGVDGLTAYVATSASASGVTMTEVGAVPVETPLLLVGTAGTSYDVPVTASATAPVTNLLRAGGTTIGGAEKNDYILKSDGLFHRVTTASELAEGKAYLELDADYTPTTGEARLVIIFDDEDGGTTGIQSVNGSGFRVNGSEACYNLAGQRVAQPAKGLYIVNGKKVVLK